MDYVESGFDQSRDVRLKERRGEQTKPSSIIIAEFFIRNMQEGNEVQESSAVYASLGKKTYLCTLSFFQYIGTVVSVLTEPLKLR